MSNLTLDTISVDTSLAEEYIKKYKNFEDWPETGKCWHVKDYPNRDEYILKRGKDTIPDVEVPGGNIARGIQLAKKIKENETLFSQLEYLIRKTDASDVINNIKLLTQHLQCFNDFSLWKPDIRILVNEKTPLYTLGCVACAFIRLDSAHSFSNKTFVYIVTTQKMAPLCKLFTELCAQVGWTIPLLFVCDTEEYLKSGPLDPHYFVIMSPEPDVRNLFVNGADGESGCTGVVTETADIDSALDLFINSSVSAPWKLQRIYVQESVYEEVKDALAWKCSRSRVASCIDAFATKGKVFLCDALSAEVTPAGGDRAVLVEAYRTAKELRALLQQDASAFLSVWATNAALSHELALAAPASRVWINEYAIFDGPPRSCLPVYDQIYPLFYDFRPDVETLTSLAGPWKKLTEKERVDLMVNALQDHLSTDPSDSEHVERLQEAVLYRRRNDGFFNVDADRICFSVEQHRDIAAIDVKTDVLLLDVIDSIVGGNAVTYLLNDAFKGLERLFESLKKAGVPLCFQSIIFEHCTYVQIPAIYKKMKVVSTNFGTVFAN